MLVLLGGFRPGWERGDCSSHTPHPTPPTLPISAQSLGVNTDIKPIFQHKAKLEIVWHVLSCLISDFLCCKLLVDYLRMEMDTKNKLTTSAAVGGVATPLRTCQTSSPLLLMSSFGSSVATGVSGGSAAGDVSLNDVSVHLAQGVDLEHIYELDALDTALDLAYTDVEVRNEGYQGLPVSLFFPTIFCLRGAGGTISCARLCPFGRERGVMAPATSATAVPLRNGRPFLAAGTSRTGELASACPFICLFCPMFACDFVGRLPTGPRARLGLPRHLPRPGLVACFMGGFLPLHTLALPTWILVFFFFFFCSRWRFAVIALTNCKLPDTTTS